MATFPRGRFVWHELLTTDPDAASAFYNKVVGWKSRAWDVDPTYRMWMMGQRQAGGLMRRPEGMNAPPQWMVYIAVPDVDQTARQAQTMGAQLHMGPRDIEPGRIAALEDPWGAAFSLFKPKPSDQEMSDTPELGDFTWHEYAGHDWKKAFDFYSKLFGWQHESSMEMNPGETYFMYKLPGTSQAIGGFYNLPPGGPESAHWLSYARVKNADTAAAAATKAGGRVVHGPMDVPGGGRVAMLLDPEGASFAVHAMVEQSVAARSNGKARRRAAPTSKRATAGKAKSAAKKAKPKRPARTRRRQRTRSRV